MKHKPPSPRAPATSFAVAVEQRRMVIAVEKKKNGQLNQGEKLIL